MGIFDAIKNAFDSGGIKLKLKTPNSFKWADGSIPVTVTLTGHKTEPRTVTGLRFTFREEQEDDKSGSGWSSGRDDSTVLRVDRDETIELKPLEKITVDMDFPLVTGGEKGSVGNTAGKAMDVIGMFSSGSGKYKLSVYAQVEGAKREKSSSRSISSGGIKIGVGSVSFGR